MRLGIKRKKEQVEALVKELSAAKVMAVVSLNNLPANQLSSFKEMGLKLRVKSKNVLTRALDKAGKKELVEYLKGSCALLIIDEDVFKLSIKLSRQREPAFAKPGVTASSDIVIKAGPTPFMPGQLMTELTELGVKVSPKGGKITILESAVVVQAGEVVPKSVAGLLFKLNIKPVTTGLDLIAVLDGKSLFKGEDLIIDVDQLMSDLLNAHVRAVNLSFNANIVNEFTIQLLLRKAFSQASNLAMEAGIITSSNVGEVLLNAKVKADALASKINWEVKV